MKSVLEDLRAKLVNSSVSKTVIAIVITNLFYSFLSAILFLSYMAHYHFFSYDFYEYGFLGLNQFTFTLALIVLSSSLLLFSWLIPSAILYSKDQFRLNKKNINENKVEYFFLCIGILGFFMGSYLIVDMICEKPDDANDWKLGAYIYILCLMIVSHIVISYVNSTPTRKLFSIIVFSILILSLSLFPYFRDQARLVIFSSLKVYNVGGDVRAMLCQDFDKKICEEGELILMSPKHAYILYDGDRQVTTLKRSDFKSIYLE